MEWKTEFKSYEDKDTLPLERAKIEALRRIAEQLEIMNNNISIIVLQIDKKVR